jgi:hypothetical protein
VAVVGEAIALTRRRLLAGTGALAASLVVARAPGLNAAPTWAARSPDDPVHQVLRAYVSTLVPGPVDDPEGTPGAVEAEAVEQLEAQAPYIILPLVADVTAASLATTGRDFASLSYAQREELLVAAFADPRRAPHHLVALAIGAGTFYGDFRNRVGGNHIGFPGPSDGYLGTYTDRTGHGQPQAEAVPS